MGLSVHTHQSAMQFSTSMIILSLSAFLGNAQYQFFEDDVCKNVNHTEWICTRIEKCKSALQSLKHRRPEICAFSGSSVIVCCEPSPSDVIDTTTVSYRPTTVQTTTTTGRPTTVQTTTTTNRPTTVQTTTTTNRPTTVQTTTTTNRPTTVQTTTPTVGRPLVVPPQAPSPPPNSSISVQKCYEYARSVYQESVDKPLILHPDYETGEEDTRVQDTCSINEKPLIINGEDSSPREFPHQVNLGYTFSNTIKWLCTGSLISERFVLSAAHCSMSRFGAPVWAVTGDLDIESDSDDARPQRIRIIQHIDHPEYHDKVYNDIALYQLEKAVTFDAFTRPACLNNLRNIAEKQAIATGWGLIRTGGPSSAHLQKVRLNFINHTKCIEFWKKGGSLKNGIDDETMICAGDLEGEKDTCGGDSGGPLQNAVETPYCMYNIIGVTSFGRKICGSGAPGVYTRVSHYVPWIESVVWPQL